MGFGELFRILSYQDIGPAAMMSRASAGLARGKIIVSLPGSEGAVRLAMTKLLIPELGAPGAAGVEVNQRYGLRPRRARRHEDKAGRTIVLASRRH